MGLLLLSPFTLLPLNADWREDVGSEVTGLLEEADHFPATFYIATNGDDAWSVRLAAPNSDGTDGPFRTFQKAKDAIRASNAIPVSKESATAPLVVEVREGEYDLTEPIEFDAADSGAESAPVIWRGEPGKTVLINAGRYLNDPQPVTDPAILERLAPDARDKIVQFDLKALGIDDFGTLDGGNNAQLFQNDQPMTIARYPNEGFITINRLVTEGTHVVDIRGVKGITEGKFYFEDDEFLNWEKEDDLWAFGYWFWDWSVSRQQVAKINREEKILELTEPWHGYGYRIGQYYYIYNALRELDVPGEFFIDRKTGILYYYPVKEIEEKNLLFSLLPNIVTARGVSHFVLTGFTFEGCRHTAVNATGSDLVISKNVIRNIGGNGISVGGPRSLVFGNHLYNLGSNGIGVDAGDRKTLTLGHSAIVNNDIHHFGVINLVYSPGIHFGGCGITVAHNRITDAPHCAILFSGNENRIEQNEIGNVCFETNDAGAIYCGRDLTMRGNLIKNNYLHDITGFQDKGCVGVYLDDMFSSADIVGNLFVKVTNATFIGGGRDCSIVNNLFINCEPSIHVDARALNWAAYHAKSWVEEIEKSGTVCGIDFTKPPYSERYPKLLKITEGKLEAPEGNYIARNVVIRNAWNRWTPDVFEGDGIDSVSRPYLTIEDNVIGDYRLLMSLDQSESISLPNKRIQFDRIPTESIGLFPSPAAITRP